MLPANEEYEDGLPLKVEEVLSTKEEIVILGQIPNDISEVFKKVELQGTGQIDVDNIVLAEGVTIVEKESAIFESNKMAERETLPVNFEQSYAVILEEVEGIGKREASISLAIQSIQYKLDFDAQNVKEILVKIPNTITAVYDTNAGWDGEKVIGKFPIKLPAGFSIDVKITLVAGVDGSVHLEYRLDNMFGVHYTENTGLQKITEMNKSWEMELDANAKAGARLTVNINWAGGVRNKFSAILGNEAIAAPIYTVRTDVGVGVNVNTIPRMDDNLICANAAIYLYWDLVIGEDCILSSIAPILQYEWQIFDEDNSPLKEEWHFENMKRVEQCTYLQNRFQVVVLDEMQQPIEKAWVFFHSIEGTEVYKTNVSGIVEGELSEGNYNYIVLKSGYKACVGNVLVKSGEITNLRIGLAAADSDTASNSEKIPVLYSGTFKGMNWMIDANGKMVISGEYMEDSDSYQSPNWQAYRDSVSEVIITAQNIKSTNSWFMGFEKLESVEFLGSVENIGSSTFSGCNNLKSIEIPKNVTSIDGGAFYGCSSLMNIEVEEENKNYCSVDGVLFSKNQTTLCSYPGGRSGYYQIPENVTAIGEDAFCGCSNLTAIEIKGKLQSIGKATFYGCDSLTSIKISGSVNQIEDYAFASMVSLQKIYMNESVEIISDKAFWYCDGLMEIEVEEGNKNYCSVDGVLFSKDKTSLIRYPTKKEGDYKIPNEVTAIWRYAFGHCSSLTSVELPSGVKVIWENVFSGCTSLTNVELPSALEVIAPRAFSGCSSLRSIRIPSNVTSINYWAFYGCVSLESIELLPGLTMIDRYAFENCKNLTIYCIENSYAHKYAIECGIPYILIEKIGG